MPTTLLNAHCELGENPLWNGDDDCLYWTDITGGVLHRLHLASGRHDEIYRGTPVAGFSFQENGDLLLFRVNDLALLHAEGRIEIAREFSDDGAARFNDVIADPEGRVFAGTIGRSDTSGGLWRVDRDGTMTLLFRGTGISNGMGFSPDLRTFYWSCSTRLCIFAYDYDRASGALSAERIFYQATPEEGIPDGMTVDVHGHIWSARWDGFAVVHHAPDGKVLERLTFPVAKVSSLCFGGPNLDQLLVTTAGGSPENQGLEGAVFQHAADVSGRLEFRSRIEF